MDFRIKILLLLILLSGYSHLRGQGWVAEITVNINHGDYAQEIINTGSVTFGGQTVEISNQMAPVSITITGVGEPSGLLEVSVSASAQNPYPTDPPNNLPHKFPLIGTYSGSHNFDCIISNYAGNGANDVNGTIALYPRVTLSNPIYTGACSESAITLNANSCSGYQWGISASSGGPYLVIPGQTSSALAVTRAMVSSMGFANSVLTFYVTAIGRPLTRSEQRMVTLYAPPPQFTAAKVDPSCSNGTGTINISITPSTPAVTNFTVTLFQHASGPEVAAFGNFPTIATFPNLAAGQYWIQVVNDSDVGILGDCGTPRMQGPTIVAPAAVSVSLTTTNVLCNGYANGQIVASVQNATQPFNYSWTGAGSGSNPRTNLSAGEFSVTVTDVRGCTGSGSASVSQPALLTVDASSPTNYSEYQVSCVGNSDGEITTTVSGGTGTKTYWWSSGHSTPTVSNVGVGNYSVTVTDANGCQANDNVQLTAPPQMSFAISELSDIDCPGTGPGSATGSLTHGPVTNAIGSLTYLWNTGQTSSSINNLSAGNYSLTITDAQGCSASDNHSLVAPQPFTVQISPESNYNGSRISCYGESDGSLSAQLYDLNGQPTPALSYEWLRNNNSFSFGALLNGANAATYLARVTYGGGCIAEQTYVLQQPAPITPLISPTSNHHGFPISCPGNSDGALTATPVGGTPGGYSFAWDNGPATAIISGISAGTYFVSITDINGCVGSGSYDLNDPLPIIPSINISSNYHGQALSCANANDGILTASSLNGAQPIQFTWSTGAIGQVINGLAAGNYTVTATDANNCQVVSQPIEIANPDPVQASISILSDYNGQAIRCHNESNGILRATGTGGTNSFSFVWSTSQTTSEINGLSQGSYSVTVSDQNNCQDSEIVELLNPQEVVALIKSHSDFNGFGVQCFGSENGFIEVEASGGTNTFSFEWPSLSETTPYVQDLGAGIYDVVVTDSNGCQDDLSFEITEPDLLLIDLLSSNNVTCFGGSDGVLIANPTGGTGTLQFSIDNLNWQSSPAFNSLVARDDYEVTVRDANSCIASFMESVTQPSEIKVEFLVKPSLCSEPVGEVAALSTGGVGVHLYHWRNSSNQIISTESGIAKLPSGIYTLEVTDESQCEVKKNIGVPSLDGPILYVVESNPTSCSASSDGTATVAVANGNGPFSIVWENSQADWSRTNLMAGLHYASVSDINSCTTVIEVMTESPEPVTVTALEKMDPSCFMFCDGKIVTVASGGNGEFQFTWNQQIGSNERSGLCAGIHQIQVIDRLGCTGILNVNLNNPQKLSVNVLNKKLPDCHDGCDGKLEVSASGGDGNYSYLWNSGSSSPLIENICPDSHKITAFDGKGCEVSETFVLGNISEVAVDLIQFQSPVCFGDCNGVLEVNARGGAGNYKYVWDDGMELSKNSSLCAGEHEVIVLDQNNCESREVYSMPGVPALKVDLGGGIVLCEGQQHELDAGTSWKSVEWREDGNLVSTAQKIIITQPAQYSVEVRDHKNCKATDTFLMETSNDLLEASFIVTAEASVGDTIAIIDISWPLPDNISWKFPDEMIKLQDLQDVVFGKFDEGGEYAITLNASLGQCNDEVTKTITILDDGNGNIGGRLGAEDFVKLLTLHPNPNAGAFEVEVEFMETSPIAILIWNTVNSKLVAEVRDDGSSRYLKNFSLSPISAGTYILKVEYKGGARVLRLLIH